MFSVLMEGCHVGYSREFIGWVYCTCGQLNMTIGSIKKKKNFSSKYVLIKSNSILLNWSCAVVDASALLV